jgi:hypothetical protein
MDGYSGVSFERGLYRLHDQASGALADRVVGGGFPAFRDRIHCFGFDWMGCQFALSKDRSDGTEPLVVMFEPATGEVLEVECSFQDFHNVVVVQDTVHALAVEGFIEWAEANPGSLPLDFTQCVGHKAPLFLGGEDTIENMEVGDIEVYWHLLNQLRAALG